ncbi:hypothetical protein [Deinococcus wulumuqiensis]|uniref:hypothetical protein n=1 Tax=Deinococcus wulumuqiensis TaxID=980427 RepID=UPI0013C31B23|nr:hypothetical protein [Deinococcus wulumuqiensis]
MQELSGIRISSEFLQRALGFGQEGDPLTVGIFPDALPDDFPLTLPELPGLRLLGSVRGVATRWSFNRGKSFSPERRQWRVFLDVGTALDDTMATFQAALLFQGWESGRAFAQTFVEAGQTRWLALNPARGWQLDLAGREAAGESGTMTQVWLTLTEADAQTIRHLLGQHEPPFDHVHLPMPLLRLPAGWRSQMSQGSGGRVIRIPLNSCTVGKAPPVHPYRGIRIFSYSHPLGLNLKLPYSIGIRMSSEEYALRGPGGAAALWPVLLPQLAAQGWALLHHSEDTALFRTPHGTGLLSLAEGEAAGDRGEVAATVVHLGQWRPV